MWVKHDKTIINHPQIIAIFIGGMFTIWDPYWWFTALFYPVMDQRGWSPTSSKGIPTMLQGGTPQLCVLVYNPKYRSMGNSGS